jgi:hypothetical protein
VEIKRYDDEVISQEFSSKTISMTGPAGTSFLEDTFGLHKGKPVEKGNRLVLQVEYSYFPIGAYPKIPRNLRPPRPDGFDAWTNRLVTR